MADEINMQAVLTLQREALALQCTGNMTCSQTGTKGILNQVSVGTGSGGSAAKLFDATSPAPLASLGCIFIKNISTDTTNNPIVDVSYDSNFGASAIISTLKPGEFCLLGARRTGSSPYQAVASLYGKSNYAATPVLIGITEV